MKYMKIKKCYSYLIKFENKEKHDEAFLILTSVANNLISMGVNRVSVTINMNPIEMALLLLGINFKIISIGTFAEVDARTDQEKIDEILEKITMYGLDNITPQDRVLLDELTNRL